MAGLALLKTLRGFPARAVEAHNSELNRESFILIPGRRKLAVADEDEEDFQSLFKQLLNDGIMD
jgi:hypothetical protein